MTTYDVYYKKNPTFDCNPDLTMDQVKDPEQFAKLRTVSAKNLEDLYMKQQGEVWSPHGEARELIQSLGLDHTSMSVGDVAIDEDNKAWQVDRMGWVEVKAVTYEERCPNCGADRDSLYYGDCHFNRIAGEIIDDASCSKCEHSWLDVYTFSGRRDIQKMGEDNDENKTQQKKSQL